MKEQINNIIIEETKVLENLLKSLEKQHEYVAKNEVFKMEKIVDDIQKCNTEVAKIEMKRRNLTKGEAMTKIVADLDDEQVENNYRKIRKLIEEVKLQKDTNELLIRQGLGFNTRMLKILKPDRSAKTYGPKGIK